ncbi:MAG: hypothetical protein JWR08_2506 [Enterovirga sp.]|nr:hypothetical protein [Enterovirga sp.]
MATHGAIAVASSPTRNGPTMKTISSAADSWAIVRLSTCSRWSGWIDRLMMATSRVRDIGAICGAEAPISTERARTARSRGRTGDNEGQGPEQGGVDQPYGHEHPALSEPVGGRAEQRPGECGADAGGGGVQPAEGDGAALGDDEGEHPDGHHRERQAGDEGEREVRKPGVLDQHVAGRARVEHDLCWRLERAALHHRDCRPQVVTHGYRNCADDIRRDALEPGSSSPSVEQGSTHVER